MLLIGEEPAVPTAMRVAVCIVLNEKSAILLLWKLRIALNVVLLWLA